MPQSDRGLGEGHSQVLVSSQAVVVELNQSLSGLLNCGHLDQGHFVILEKLESLDSSAGVREKEFQIFLCHVLWNVGNMECG